MSIKHALTRQENQMAFLIAWVVFPIVATAFGFYLGTFVVSQHVVDLQPRDIPFGVAGAGIGFALAFVVAVGVTLTYPKVIEKEYEAREAAEHSHAH